MLPDLSPTHILIVIVVALIVVGPKDLPQMLRKVGQFMGKMRGMANEFRASFDEMARQSELDELRKEVAAMRDATASALPNLESENAYMANWAASHAEPTDTPPEAFLPGPPDMTAIQAPTAGEIAAEAKAAKPRAPRKPKPEVASEDAPARPKRTRKPPVAGDEA